MGRRQITWESHAAYRNAMKVEGERRTFLLNKFLGRVLPKELFKNKERQAHFTLQSMRAHVRKYQATPAYKVAQKNAVKRNQARRKEACHSDINWLLKQFDCDIKTGIVTRPSVHKNPKTGYWQAGAIWGKQYSVAQLIWIKATGTFPPTRESGLTIDHINGSKDDNRFVNLQAIPKRDNIQKYFYGTWGIENRRKFLNEVWDVLEFYYSQPYGKKRVNTMEKYEVTEPTLNSWTWMFSSSKVKSGKREFYIEKEIQRGIWKAAERLKSIM